MAIFKKRPVKYEKEIDLTRLPRHIAIIMDGNGRWAKKRGLPRTAGHAAGSENFRDIATYCKDLGIDYLTVYAFSTENWKRPADEVNAIMGLLEKYLNEAIEKMERDNIKLRVLGDTSPLPENLKSLIKKTDEISDRLTGFQANICINYGGRDEILRGVSSFSKDCLSGKRKPEDLNEKIFSDYLYSSGIPDPDLIIRPSGEIRVSNFLLWQGAYAEYYFTDVFWPDFNREELKRAIINYQSRSRRFGGL